MKPAARAAAANIPVSLGLALPEGIADAAELLAAAAAENSELPVVVAEPLALVVAAEELSEEAAVSLEESAVVVAETALQPPAENWEYTLRSSSSWLVITSGGAPISPEQVVAKASRLEDCEDRYEYMSRQ